MEKKVLEQYRNLLQERKDIKKRIQRVQAQLYRMESDGMLVSDTVSRGKKGKSSLGIVRVEGFPDREYRNKRRQLSRYNMQLNVTVLKIEDMITEIEAYIASVDNSYVRLILRYRYIDGNSWVRVANRMGGGNTPDGCRMAADRYLQKT